MILTANNLYKSYANRSVLNDLSLAVYEGEFVGIIGPSGSGKSTLLSILATLETADQGELIYNNMEISSYTPKQLAKLRNSHFGFVFQSSNLLLHVNVFDNIALPYCYGPPKEKRDINEQVHALAQAFGIEHLLHTRSALLSGGEQQRVAMARALCNQPKIIFADEPTGNLDAKNSKTILDHFRFTCKQESRSVIMVTHDANALTFCDRVIALQKS